MNLTKTLRFDDDVLSVLQAMDWQDEGALGIITGGQLERDLYLRVNKALAAMGGKWNRKRGGHVFPLDPRAQVEGLLQNGSLDVVRDGFFETPPAVIDRMVQIAGLELGRLRWGDRILEPSAGLGAIASRLRGIAGITLHVCEKHPQRAVVLEAAGYNLVAHDFFDLIRPWYDVVVMNPPFENGQDIDHVRHAYYLLNEGGQLVSVMSEGPFFRDDRKAAEFREWLDTVGGWSEKLPANSFRESGTGIAARLVAISKD